MRYLFNSRGQHIANEVNGQLHSITGVNIGHHLEDYKIFIDMHGHYLGEIIYKNRLVYNRNSPHLRTNFGVYGNYGNVGNYGDPGKYGTIPLLPGYEDINIHRLQ